MQVSTMNGSWWSKFRRIRMADLTFNENQSRNKMQIREKERDARESRRRDSRSRRNLLLR